MNSKLETILLDLITRTSTTLPEDVLTALKEGEKQETPNSPASQILANILKNSTLAQKTRRPICQDTGTLTFHITANKNFPKEKFIAAAHAAIIEASKTGVLRQNCIDTLSDKNTGNNIGIGSPMFTWHPLPENKPETTVTLILKGGGSENASSQYSLPNEKLHAGRDLDGVRKCVLDALWQIQGSGCAPGILGIAIGGDRATGYAESKLQLLRKIGERSPLPELAELEKRLLTEGNQLGIGPMGLGGKTTLLEVFIGHRSRLPACYFVSISYMCWCCRRQTITLTNTVEF
ncbi:MAG: fumarate hydratase [Lentisphaeria bacterium]